MGMAFGWMVGWESFFLFLEGLENGLFLWIWGRYTCPYVCCNMSDILDVRTRTFGFVYEVVSNAIVTLRWCVLWVPYT